MYNYTCTVHVLVMNVSHPVIIPFNRSSFHLSTNITVTATLPSSQSTYLCGTFLRKKYFNDDPPPPQCFFCWMTPPPPPPYCYIQLLMIPPPPSFSNVILKLDWGCLIVYITHSRKPKTWSHYTLQVVTVVL